MSSKPHGDAGDGLETERIAEYYYTSIDIYSVGARESELEELYNSRLDADISPYDAELSFYRLSNDMEEEREYGVIEVENGGGKTEHVEILGKVEERGNSRYLVSADEPEDLEVDRYFDGSVSVHLEPNEFNG